MPYFELYNNNNNQYRLIFHLFSFQCLTPLAVHTRARTLPELIQT